MQESVRIQTTLFPLEIIDESRRSDRFCKWSYSDFVEFSFASLRRPKQTLFSALRTAFGLRCFVKHLKSMNLGESVV